MVHGSDGRHSTIEDRFQLGGPSLRGFAPHGVGPRENGFAVGGEHYFNVNASSDVHLGKLGEIGLRGGVFAEAGSVWGLSDAPDRIDDAFGLRSSAGVSLIVEAGNVPIELYYAVPVSKQDQDKVQSFGFSIRSNF
jgi:outer membrane protein insertion porin family